jgi:hypothetical protein
MTVVAATTSWVEANQRYLTARLGLIRAHLERHGARGATPGKLQAEEAVREAADALPAPAALDTVCGRFALSSFERDLLLMCAGVELDASFHALLADPALGQPGPTFSLALAALPEAHWSALTPAGPLRRWRLLEVGTGDTLTTSPLRITERVLHYLTGASYLDEHLEGLIQPPTAPTDLAPSQRLVAERAADAWAGCPSSVLPVIHLGGADTAAKRAVAVVACAAVGVQLGVLRGADVPAAASERDSLVRAWEREAALGHMALLVDCEEMETLRGVLAFVDQLRGAVLVAASEPLGLWHREVVRIDVDRPSPAEQRRLWEAALGAGPGQGDILDRLVSQFDLGARAIRAASAQARLEAAATDADLARRVWQACRVHARGRLDDLAPRLSATAGWDDLVLPPAQMHTLREIATQARYRARVYDTWGLAARNGRGLGISALFVGHSGTGKTMAAEVLARELELDLYRIDLSQVVSKYIGDTEKNLRRVFEGAEASGAVLLFDEADALFGKRSEVKDSHDRYANIEISYLLQRMESYRGLAILTTNMQTALDTAFARRLRFVVHFPFPDSAQRAEIWRRVYPPQTPVDGLDPGKLARLNVSGGHIRNIAVHAAFLAAESGEPVGMRHLLRAARGEYAKLERQLTDAECRDWL